MRKILILLAAFSILMIPLLTVGCGKTKPLLDYSLEGMNPEVCYFEWVYRYSEWRYLGSDPSGAKGLVMKEETFRLDRNKDGVCDLKVIKYHVPERAYRNNEDRYVTEKAHQRLTVMVDDDLDKLWDRRLYDDFDVSGNPGMDGVFEKEEAVRY